MKWILFGSSGGAGDSAPIPGQPSIVAKGYRYLPADSDGRIYVEVLATVTPPSPIGSYDGANIWLQAPDSFGVDDFSGGGLELGVDEVGATWSPSLVTWAASGEEARFRWPAPDKNNYWRLYVVAGSEDKSRLPVEKGKPGESPSVVFLVEAPPAVAVGREFAPIVENETAIVEYDLTGSESGAQRFRVKTTWDWPRGDEAIATVGGVDIALNDGDPATEDLQASMSIELDATGGSFATDWKDVPASPVQRRAEFYTYDTSGRRNSYQYGITPSVLLTIQRQNGTTGQEFAPVVTPGTPFITAIPVASATADGAEPLQVTTNWNAPADSRFGGVELVVERADGVRKPYGGGRLSPTEHFMPQPATVQTYRFWVVSRDTAGRSNTIVAGVTPYQDISVGSAAGRLNLGKGINYNATRLRQDGGSLDLKPGAIGTEFLSTTGIDIGPGAGKMPYFRVQDSFGALLAWIGDYTSVVGGYVGAWFKRLSIGGSSPSNAPIQCDSAGNVTINGATFQLTLNGVTTAIQNLFVTALGAYAGLVVHQGNELRVTVAPGDISIANRAGDIKIRLLVSDPTSGPASYSIDIRNNAGSSFVNANSTSGLLLSNGAKIFLNGSRLNAAAGTRTLPSNPLGFVDIVVDNNDVCVPYYARA
jgi:hypothetical protein